MGKAFDDIHVKTETAEWKYLIRGRTIEGIYIVIVTKLSPMGKMVIITVFSEA